MVASADIVVIGGGVIGLTIARRLVRDGSRVTVLERGLCGGEASWAGAGVLSPPNAHRKDAAAALHLRSLRMYPAFCQELLTETGVDPEYEPCGEMEVAFDETGLRSLREDVDAAAGRASPGKPSFEMLTREAAWALEPAMSREAVGAMLCRETAQVRNPRLLRALYASCVKGGVTIRENAPVVDVTECAGRIAGVRIGEGNGELLPAHWVILCAGAWSSQIAGRLQGLMPVHPIRGQMVLLKFESRPFSRVIAKGKTYLVPRRDGHVLLGATEEPEGGFGKRCTPRGIADLVERGLRLSPVIAEAPVVTTWAGLRPGTRDDLPYIGPVPGFEGLIAATGHFRTGLSMAPATADAVAAMVRNERFDLDLAACRPGRP